MQNNIMGYVTVENLPRPTTKRKWSSSATKATPSCHDWKREVGHNKFTSALSQIKGHQHRDLNLTIPKTVWSEFEVIMATTLCQNQTYNCETSTSVLTRSTLTQGIYNKRCFIGYVLQFSLPFLNLENTSTATSTSWIASQGLASPQTSFGVRLSRIHFSQNEPQRTSAGRLNAFILTPFIVNGCQWGISVKRFLIFYISGTLYCVFIWALFCYFFVVSNSRRLPVQREESRAVRMCKSSSRCQAGCCKTKTRGTETDCLSCPFEFFLELLRKYSPCTNAKIFQVSLWYDWSTQTSKVKRILCSNRPFPSAKNSQG